MAYQLRLRLRAIGFIDLILSGLSIILFLVGAWFLANDIYRRGIPMLVGTIGALSFVGLKSFGFWTCCKLISVINHSQNEDLNDLEQQQFRVAWNWLKTKVFLLIVPVCTLGFIMMGFGDCWACMTIAIGWIVLEVLLIILGRVYMVRN